jgi:tetratricopeptide (TPR) repeat protein
MQKTYWLLSAFFLVSCTSLPVLPKNDSTLHKAEEEYLRGNFANAFYLYEKSINTEPPSYKLSSTYFRMGICLLKMENPSRALNFFKLALDTCKDDILQIRIYEKMGSTYNILQEPEKASEFFEKAYQYPDHLLTQAIVIPNLYYNLGISYLRSAQWQKGRSLLEKSLAKFPQSKFAERTKIVLSLGKDRFYLQFGYFYDPANARNLVETIKQKGIAATVKEINLDTKKSFLVVGQDFVSRKDAFLAAQELKTSGFDVVVLP